MSKYSHMNRHGLEVDSGYCGNPVVDAVAALDMIDTLTARVSEIEAELKTARNTIQKQHIMISAIERALEGDP